MPAGFLRKLFSREAAQPFETTKVIAEKKEKRIEAKRLAPFEVAFDTRASTEHPELNQDACVVDAVRQMLMVADGVGGVAKGEIASRAAQEAMGIYDIYLDELMDQKCAQSGVPYLTVDQASEIMDTHFSLIADYVHDAVKNASEVKSVTAAATTLLTAKVFETAPGERYVIVKSVGDSYPMVRRADGTVEMIDIEEDGIVQSWVKKGEVTEDELFLISESGSHEELAETYTEFAEKQGLEISPEKMSSLKKRFDSYFGNGSRRQARSEITQYVGKSRSEKISIHSAVVKVNPGDQLFFSTDGIDALRRRQIQDVLRGEGTVVEKTKALVSAATEANSIEKIRTKPDDITVVGMQVPEDSAVLEQTRQTARLAEVERVKQEDRVNAEAARLKAFSRAKSVE